MAKYDDKGREVPDRTRIEVPLRYRNAPSMDQRVQAMLAQSRRLSAEDAAGDDTEEEAEDFLVEDPEERRSIHEVDEATDQVIDAFGNLQEAWESHKKLRQSPPAAPKPDQATPPKEEDSDAT